MALKLQTGLQQLIAGEPVDEPVIGERESPTAMLLRLAKLWCEIEKLEAIADRRSEVVTSSLGPSDREILDRFASRPRAHGRPKPPIASQSKRPRKKRSGARRR